MNSDNEREAFEQEFREQAWGIEVDRDTAFEIWTAARAQGHRCSECGPVDGGTALYCVKCWEGGEVEPVAFLIWSNEHNAYWRPNSAGYTRSIAEAGRYGQAEADKICKNASPRAGSELDETVPPEMMMVAPESIGKTHLAPTGGTVPERKVYSVDRLFLVELIAERQKRIDDLELQVKELLAAAPATPPGADWVRCSDRMPEIGQRVKLFSQGVIQNYMPVLDEGEEGPFWDFEQDYNPEVNFQYDQWMPMPQPPKDKQEGGK